MCGGPMTAVLRSTAETLKAQAREALGGWQSVGLPASSGCDSSDCAYCQALARMRQPGAPAAAPTACWLRRKRSRTDLAGMTEEAPSSSVGEQEPASASCASSGAGAAAAGPGAAAAGPPPSQASMWDHALLVEEPAAHSTAAAAAEAQAQAAADDQWWLRRRPCGSASPPRGDAASGSSRSRRRGSSSMLGALAAETDDSSSDGGSGSAATAGGSGRHASWPVPAALHEVAAFVPPEPYRHRQDIVCALEFEEHGWLLATAGVSKQVRVYSLASCLQHPEDAAYCQPIRCHRMASKLSSLAWNPDAPGAVTVADYDGVVSQLDLESGHLIAEADEHCGRRVWSVSHSLQRPHLCASASDDGTVRLWGGAGMRSCLAALRPGGGVPATGVHLSQFDGDLAAVACADHSAYVYDLRRADRPLLQLAGHGRAVSYVRWLGARRLVTASTDASLAVWQLPDASGAAAAAGQQAGAQRPGRGAGGAAATLAQPWKRLRGHSNSKNFVGLSVRPEGCLVACGSEAPACYAYHDAWAAPMAVHRFSPVRVPGGLACTAPPPSPVSHQPLADQFCSAVCWQPATARLGAAPLLATAASNGDLRVLELRRPPADAAPRGGIEG